MTEENDPKPKSKTTTDSPKEITIGDYIIKTKIILVKISPLITYLLIKKFYQLISI